MQMYISILTIRLITVRNLHSNAPVILNKQTDYQYHTRYLEEVIRGVVNRVYIYNVVRGLVIECISRGGNKGCVYKVYI